MRGRPAAGVAVLLERNTAADRWEQIAQGVTDSDGRLRNLLAGDAQLDAGVYRLIFSTRRYFEQQGTRAFYPEVVVVFETSPGESHYHVPLLLNAFGYTTYRGS